MRVAVFGTGIIYSRLSLELKKVTNIAFLIDNNVAYNSYDDIPVIKPSDIVVADTDIFVLASNKYSVEMRNQLLALGVPKEKIKHFDEFLQPYRKGKISFEYKQSGSSRHLVEKYAIEELNRRAGFNRSILRISYHANYDGGSLAAVHAAMALQSSGYQPVLAVPSIDDKFLEEVINKDICVAICPNLINPSEVEMDWIGHWQRILVNTLQMSHATFAIGKRQKVVAWLHESPEVYESYEYFHNDFQKAFNEKNVYLYAVSRVAKENFFKYYQCNEHGVGVLPYGLPDLSQDTDSSISKSNKPITFALIGGISKEKGVDIYFDAIEKVNKILNDKANIAEFLLIGRNSGSSFANSMIKRASRISNVRYIGQKNREDMGELYSSRIDVVVVASRNETMSMTATEAMVFDHIAIVSNISGICDYFTNYYDGLIFESENSDELASKILWCIKHPEKVHSMGINTRKTYKKEFSMEKFSSRLDIVIKEKRTVDDGN